MRTLYIDCSMGAAGDMLMASLLELLPQDEGDKFLKQMNQLGLSGVKVVREAAVKCGICGTHMNVTVHGEEESEEMHDHDHHDHDHDHHDHDHHDHDHHDHDHEHHHDDHHHHHHSSMADIQHIVEHMPVSEKVKQDVLAVYGLIAEAESHAHGKPVTEIHFHEVGTMDAIADVTGVCLLMEQLAPEKIIASPIHVGSGQVKCAHGVLPVPAPATAYILKNVPIYGGKIRGELCTPTGAALLKYFVGEFADMPVMHTVAIGYGMGKKDFEAANCVRSFLGETTRQNDMVLELSCNLDDMTAEETGFATEELLRTGALEVFTVPVCMKKSRPGILMTVLCREEDKDQIVSCIFKHTTTIGIREKQCKRYILERKLETIRTSFGPVQKKISTGYGVTREKFEYNDLARIALENGLSIEEVRNQIMTEEKK